MLPYHSLSEFIFRLLLNLKIRLNLPKSNTLSDTRIRPQLRVPNTAMAPATYIVAESISPNMEEIMTAVTMYFAMSISHLPSSFLI